MKHIIIFFYLFSLHAQEIVNDPARPVIGKTGQIFLVKIIPATRRLEISLVDSPQITLTPSEVSIRGKIYSLEGAVRSLKLKSAGKYLELPDAVESASKLELKIEHTGTKKSETIEIQTKP